MGVIIGLSAAQILYKPLYSQESKNRPTFQPKLGLTELVLTSAGKDGFCLTVTTISHRVWTVAVPSHHEDICLYFELGDRWETVMGPGCIGVCRVKRKQL